MRWPTGVVVAAAVFLLGAVGCATTPRSAVSPAVAVLRIASDVPDATLWVDDHPLGQVRDLARGVRLRPGRHRIEIRHDDYHTRYLEVTLRRGQVRTVEVHLHRRFD